MIVRLMGEGQFELDKKHMTELNKIDNNVVKLVEKGSEKAFKTEFRKLEAYVHRYGKPVPHEIIKPSDVIIPPADITLDEARKIFKGDGLIPD